MIPWKPNQQNYWTRCMAWEFCVMKCPCGPTSISVVPIQNTIRIQDHQLVFAHYLSCNLGIIASQKSTQIFWRLSSIHDNKIRSLFHPLFRYRVLMIIYHANTGVNVRMVKLHQLKAIFFIWYIQTLYRETWMRKNFTLSSFSGEIATCVSPIMTYEIKITQFFH